MNFHPTQVASTTWTRNFVQLADGGDREYREAHDPSMIEVAVIRLKSCVVWTLQKGGIHLGEYSFIQRNTHSGD